MTGTSSAARVGRRGAALAVLLALGTAGTAYADISGTVRTPRGAPVPGVTVEARDPAGAVVAFDNTDGTGAFVIPTTAGLGASPGPFTISTSTRTCRSGDRAGARGPATARVPAPVADGVAALAMRLDVPLVCAAFEPVGAVVTGHVRTDKAEMISTPRGRFAVDLLVPFESTELTVTSGARVLGRGAPRLSFRFTAPSRPGSYPLRLNWATPEGPGGRSLGRLIVRRVAKPARTSGPLDVAVAIDTTGVLGNRGSGRARRADIVRAATGAARRGDRVVGVTFAGSAATMFRRTRIAFGGATLVRRARTARLSRVAGADFGVGLAAARQALAARPLQPRVAKSVIFVTDGPHTFEEYDNAHLRLAVNGTARSWPVCAIGFGSGIDAEARRTLTRIARDTKGSFRRARTPAQLRRAVARCVTDMRRR